MSKDPHRYDDMLDLPHPTSKKHPRMSAVNRAAQFAPFAALTGYDAQVVEAARLTDAQTELSENELSVLDGQLRLIQEHLAERPVIEITHFVPDERKSGGSYRTDTGIIKKIDLYTREIMLYDEDGIHAGQMIEIDRIVDLDGEIFVDF